jgi:hypothetical protein
MIVDTSNSSRARTGGNTWMISYLIVTRIVMIWINLAVMPAVLTFDAIEAKLERRAVAARGRMTAREKSARICGLDVSLNLGAFICP